MKTIPSSYILGLGASISRCKGLLRTAKSANTHDALMEDLTNLRQEYAFATA
jgi:hypothetical protein